MNAKTPLRIAVAGAGLIGKTHIRLITECADCQLAAIVDPHPAALELAQALGVPRFGALADLLTTDLADAVILATPNALHAQQAQQCVVAGIPALIEKPVVHDVAAGEALLALMATHDTPLLVGHHRMHSAIMRQAKQLIVAGVLGQLVAVTGSALFYKPDDYFAAGPWRTQPGGGPVLINMIHEVGNLRYLCGDVVAVQAMASHARRGFAVEDTIGILLQFDSGVIGTFILSDTAASARSWEQTAQENPAYPSYADEDCYHLAGSLGSVSIPSMRVKHYDSATSASWWQPFQCETPAFTRTDPLAEQLQHFCRVIRREVEPLVTVRDGLQNLRVTEAIVAAAQTGSTIKVV